MKGGLGGGGGGCGGPLFRCVIMRRLPCCDGEVGAAGWWSSSNVQVDGSHRHTHPQAHTYT